LRNGVVLAAYKSCDAETAGYDGWFGVYCERPSGHDGDHFDGLVRWDHVDDYEPIDVVAVAKRPLLRDASRVVIYQVGRENWRVVGTSSAPHWQGIPDGD
jgi:hypothetical protein